MDKKPYELSLWESGYNSENNSFNEKKAFIFGSDTMTSQGRALDVTFTPTVNGTKKLTFKMYYRYIDTQTGEWVDNVYCKYLTNESRLKLKYQIRENDDPWHEFVIKSIVKNSEDFSYTYTAEDAFQQELGKTGYDITLTDEDGSSQGTADELGARALEGTDWTIRESDNIVQTQIENLVPARITATEGISVTKFEIQENGDVVTTQATLNENDEIYIFYSSAISQSNEIQFLYLEGAEYKKDSDRIITNAPQYLYKTDARTLDNRGYYMPSTIISTGIPNPEYRGKRLVIAPKTFYHPTLQRYVGVYEKDNVEYYGYEDYEYISPILLKNYISNSSDFTSTSGWRSSRVGYTDEIELTTATYPTLDLSNGFNTNNFNELIGTLSARGLKSGAYFFNTGFSDNAKLIKSLANGDKYSLYLETYSKSISAITVSLQNYIVNENGEYELGELKPLTWELNKDENGDSPYCIFYGTTAISESVSEETYRSTRWALVFTFGSYVGDFVLKQCICTKYLAKETSGSGRDFYLPTEVSTDVTVVKHCNIIDKEEYSDVDKIIPFYTGDTFGEYQTVLSPNYQRVNSIKIEHSNCFNILQEISETFGCWVKIWAEHDDNGKITTELVENYTPINKDYSLPKDTNVGGYYIKENGNYVLVASNTLSSEGITYYYKSTYYKPKKFVSFKNYIGQDSDIGFKYGININSIRRTIDSKEIVTKLIVGINSNEFGRDGYCDISRAESNEIKDNFILNFDHYINQNKLDVNEFYKDLYSKDGNYLNLYNQLNYFNSQLLNANQEIISIANSIVQAEADIQVYENGQQAARTNKAETGYSLKLYCGKSIDQITSVDIEDDKKIEEYVKQIMVYTASDNEFTAKLASAREQYNELQKKYEEINSTRSYAINMRKILLDRFNSKYAQYILEGSWIDEAYYDDDEYYLDALQTAYNSASPKISYDISVVDVSSLEGYELYKYSIGDRTYIEDVEFFGYDDKKRPFKEPIVVTEATYKLDDPASNSIRVQNYKDQFASLFQRITASTQKLQFAQGSYERAAAAITAAKAIDEEYLQNSLNDASLILRNMGDQTVQWDNMGITVTEGANPARILRLVSGGILLTDDGGQTWNIGLTNQGISARWITSGQVDTSVLQIMNGDQAWYRWDKYGISAYKHDNITVDYSSAIRFDQFGIYAFTGVQNFYPTELGQIKELPNKTFYLLNDGSLYIKGNGEFDGKITASSGNIGDWEIKDGHLQYGEYGSSGSVWLIPGGKTGVSIGGAPVTEPLAFTIGQNLAITTNGNLYAKDGVFSGTVNATAGNIGGCIIEDNHLTVTGAYINNINADTITSGTLLSRNSGSTFALNLDAGTISSTYFNLTPTGASFTGNLSAANGNFVANSSGISIKDGSITCGNGAFEVDANGNLSAANGNFIANTAGISITNGSIKYTNGSFEVTNEGKVTAIDITITDGNITCGDFFSVTKGTDGNYSGTIGPLKISATALGIENATEATVYDTYITGNSIWTNEIQVININAETQVKSNRFSGQTLTLEQEINQSINYLTFSPDGTISGSVNAGSGGGTSYTFDFKSPHAFFA